MKSVMVPINRDEGLEARFQVAIDIVRAFEGHLTCLQAGRFDSFTALDPYGVGYMLTETVEYIREAEEKEKKACETRLQNEGLSWSWVNELSDPGRLVANHSWLADLIVASQPKTAWRPRFDAPPTAAEAIMSGRAPVLVVPDEARKFDCGGTIVVAWNGSPESCAAIKGALPLLRKARAVHLVTVSGADEFDLPPVEGAAYLSRHGVSCEMTEIDPGPAPITDTLLEAAEVRKAACLVMGAYGHSRLRENILGGVTRGMLQKAKMPLLLAH